VKIESWNFEFELIIDGPPCTYIDSDKNILIAFDLGFKLIIGQPLKVMRYVPRAGDSN
jgi:hypothetical protein